MIVPRWYVDADTLGLARLLIQVRRDVTFPGDSGERRRGWSAEPCFITETSTPDDVWIPRVAAAGLAIITRDRRIAERTSERLAVLESGARMFAITSRPPLNNWGVLEVVISQWRALEKAAEEPGPYIYHVTRTTMAKIDL